MMLGVRRRIVRQAVRTGVLEEGTTEQTPR